MVYWALKISKLGVDKIGRTKSGKTLNFWDCHVFPKNGILAIFPFLSKIRKEIETFGQNFCPKIWLYNEFIIYSYYKQGRRCKMDG